MGQMKNRPTLQLSAASSFDILKDLDRDSANIDARLQSIAHILAIGPSIPHTSKESCSRARYGGRAGWALRWLLDGLRDLETLTQPQLEQFWSLIQVAADQLPPAQCAKTLASHGFVSRVRDSISSRPPSTSAPLAADDPANSEREIRKPKKRKGVSVGESQLETKKRRINEGVPTEIQSTAALHIAPATANCVAAVQGRVAACSAANLAYEARCLRSALSTTPVIAASILRASLASTISRRSASLAPFLTIWSDCANSSTLPATEINDAFKREVLLVAMQWQLRHSTETDTQSDVRTLRDMIARHALLPSKFVVTNRNLHLTALQVLRREFQGDARPCENTGMTAAIVLEIAVRCCLTSLHSRANHETVWLEDLFITLTRRLESDREWPESWERPYLDHLIPVLEAVLSLRVVISRNTWRSLLEDICRCPELFTERHFIALGLIANMDPTAFLASGKSEHLAGLDKILHDASAIQWSRPSSDSEYLFAGSDLNNTLRLKIIVPLMRSFAKAGQLEHFLMLWQRNYIASIATKPAGMLQTSIWDDGQVVAELQTCLASAMSSATLERYLQTWSTSIDEALTAVKANIAELTGCFQIVKCITHSLKSVDAARILPHFRRHLSAQWQAMLKKKVHGCGERTSLCLNLLASCIALPISHTSSEQDTDLIVEEARAVLRLAKLVQKQIMKTDSATNAEAAQQLSSIIYWTTATHKMIRHDAQHSNDFSRVMASLESIAMLVGEQKLLDHIRDPSVLTSFELQPQFLLLVRDTPTRRELICSYIKMCAVKSTSGVAVDCPRLHSFAHLSVCSATLVNDLVRAIDDIVLHGKFALSTVNASLAFEMLMKLPWQSVPRIQRERFLDAMLPTKGSTVPLKNVGVETQLALSLELLKLPHGSAQIARNFWAVADTLKELGLEDPTFPRKLLKAVIDKALGSLAERVAETKITGTLEQLYFELQQRVQQPASLTYVEICIVDQGFLLHRHQPRVRALLGDSPQPLQKALHALPYLLQNGNDALLTGTLTCCRNLSDDHLVSIQDKINGAILSRNFASHGMKAAAEELTTRVNVAVRRSSAFDHGMRFMTRGPTTLADFYNANQNVASIASSLSVNDIDHLIQQCQGSSDKDSTAIGKYLTLQCILSNNTAVAWWTGASVGGLIQTMADKLALSHTLEEFGAISEVLILLLRKSQASLTQDATEHVLHALIRLTSPATATLPKKAAQFIFTQLVEISRILVATHRRHLRGRLHLLTSAIRGLLRCFFTSDRDLASQLCIRVSQWASPGWLDLQHGDDSGAFALDVAQADQFARLLVTTCEPSASAARTRRGKQHSMVDELALAKSQAGEHMAGLIFEWADCFLKGRLANRSGMREALMPGIWSVLDCVGHDVLEAKADLQRSEKRAIVTALLAEWRRTRGTRTM